MMWNEAYAIGIEAIDNQHRQLFETVEKLLSSLNGESGAGPTASAGEAVNTIHFLKGYVVEHFDTEEAYMGALGHPGLGEHRRMHQSFTKAVAATEDKIYESSFDVKTIRMFAGLLLSWLKTHVTGVDMTIVRGAVEADTLKEQEKIVSDIYTLG